MDEKTLKIKKMFAGKKVPSMRRRNDNNDYYARRIYMITVTVSGRRPILGHFEGSTSASYSDPQYPHIVSSDLGSAVQQCWYDIPKYHPEIEIYALQLMPDHLHGILFVTEQMEQHLGRVIAGFKIGCNKAYRSIFLGETETVSKNNAPQNRTALLWEEKYNDRILYQPRQLIRWKRYLYENPNRLMLKREHPDLFRVRQNVKYGPYSFSALGNIFLLTRPYKQQLQCSRKLTQEDIERKCLEMTKAAKRGAVTISPSISPGEKSIMRSLFNGGFPLICLRENGLTAFSKPGGKELMDACADGRLLIMAPWEHHNEHTTISRNQCLSLNNIAAYIANFEQ